MAAFGTFGGPPPEVFEVDMLFRPISDHVETSGGRLVANMGLTSCYHELYALPLKRLASRIKFKKPGIVSICNISDHELYRNEQTREVASLHR